MKSTRLIVCLGTLGLFLLHNNFWSWQPDLTLLLNRLPVELVYRLLWVVASMAVLWLALRGWWRESR